MKLAGLIACIATLAASTMLALPSAAHAQGAVFRDSAGVRIITNGARTVQLPARQVARIGAADGDPRHILFSIYAVALDGAGNHYIGMEAEIRVFDRDGRYVRTIGGKGKGPGEFGMPPFPIWFSGDSILAMDRNLMRTSAFNAAGELLGTYTSLGHAGLAIRPIGRSDLSWIALVESTIEDGDDEAAMRRMYSYIKLAPGEIGEFKPLELRRYYPVNDSLGETVYRIPNERIIGIAGDPGFTQRPFEDRPAYAVNSNGSVFAKTPTQYRVDVFDARGRMTHSIRRAFDPIPVTQADFEGMPQLIMDAGMINMTFGQGMSTEMKERFLADRLRSETTRVNRLKQLPLPAHRHPAGRILVAPGNMLMVERADFMRPAVRAAFHFNARYRVASRWDFFNPAGTYIGTTDFPLGFRPMYAADDGRVTGVFTDEDNVEYVSTFQVTLPATR